MIIVIGGEKGGTGKTTLATNLSVMRPNVLLVDTDRQGTASNWCARRDELQIVPRIPSVQKFTKSVFNDVKELAKNYSDIIIDAGGRDSVELRSALVAADKAIFPVRASQFDLWTLECIANLVETAKSFNQNLKAYIVINQASSHPHSKEAKAARELIEDFNELQLLDTVLTQRIIYRNAASEGRGITEIIPRDTKAINELELFYTEVYSDE